MLDRMLPVQSPIQLIEYTGCSRSSYFKLRTVIICYARKFASQPGLNRFVSLAVTGKSAASQSWCVF
jgi:hypothetical protein